MIYKFLVFLSLFLTSNFCQEIEFENATEFCENSTCTTKKDSNSEDPNVNGTELNVTTVLPIVTTNVTMVTTVVPIETTSPITLKNETGFLNFDVTEKEEICLCNLEKNSCEINCCCDSDCSMEQKQIFSSCDKKPEFTDPKFCHSIDYVYINNSRSTIDIINNELFCIKSTNLPKSYLIQASQPIKTITESENLIKNMKTWPKFEENILETFNLTKFSRHGDFIWIFNNKTKMVENFALPSSFVSNACLKKSNVKFFENFKSSCIHNVNEELNSFLNPESFLDIYFLSFNNSLNSSLYENIDFKKDCPKEICAPVKIHLCETDFNNCGKIDKNDPRLVQNCRFSLYSNEQHCVNLLKNVKVEIFHNGTQGIEFSNILFVLKNQTFYNDNSLEFEYFEQSFDVDFLWAKNKKTNLSYVDFLSGNPGYIVGKPVIVANLNYSTLNVTFLSEKIYFEFNKNLETIDEHFLVIPGINEGLCDFSKPKIVNFGINLRSICKINFEYLKDQKNSEIEQNNIQVEILGVEKNSNLKISERGNNSKVKNLETETNFAKEKNSNVKNPSVKNSNVKNPSVKNSNVENPSVKNSNVENPSVKNSNVENPNVKNANVEYSKIKNSERDKYSKVKILGTEKLISLGPFFDFFENENSSFQNPCLDFQKKIFNFFLIVNATSGKYLASYGNANRSKISDFIELKYNFNLNETLEKIKFTNLNSSITCENLVNRIAFKILYSKIDIDQNGFKIKNQNKIVGAFVEVSSTKKIVTILKNSDSLEYFRVVTEVMFFDVTTPKIKKFVSPRALDLKLPKDFFYPFFSKASISKINLFLLVLTFLWSL